MHYSTFFLVASYSSFKGIVLYSEHILVHYSRVWYIYRGWGDTIGRDDGTKCRPESMNIWGCLVEMWPLCGFGSV